MLFFLSIFRARVRARSKNRYRMPYCCKIALNFEIITDFKQFNRLICLIIHK